MKCYTISEGREPHKGLTISDDYGEPSVAIGEDETASIVPVNEGYKVAFYNRRDYIRRMQELMRGLDQRDTAESCDESLRAAFREASKHEYYPGQLRRQMEMAWEDHKEISERFSKSSWHLIHGHVWSKENDNRMVVRQADISDRNEKHPMRLIKEREEPERRDGSYCLVHVATDTLVDGKMWFEATNWDEVIGDSDGVDRVFKPFPSVGIEILARGYSAHGAPQALIRMMKRASFRICRSGNFAAANEGLVAPYRDRGAWKGDEGFAYPVMVVVWPGSSLRCFPPKRFEVASKHKAA